MRSGKRKGLNSGQLKEMTSGQLKEITSEDLCFVFCDLLSCGVLWWRGGVSRWREGGGGGGRGKGGGGGWGGGGGEVGRRCSMGDHFVFLGGPGFDASPTLSPRWA